MGKLLITTITVQYSTVAATIQVPPLSSRLLRRQYYQADSKTKLAGGVAKNMKWYLYLMDRHKQRLRSNSDKDFKKIVNISLDMT